MKVRIANETILEVDDFMGSDELCKVLPFASKNDLREVLCVELQQAKNKFFETRADELAEHFHDTAGIDHYINELESEELGRDQHESNRGEAIREEAAFDG